MNSKNRKIFMISMATIIILLAIVWFSYAYFKAQIDDRETSDVNITSLKPGELKFDISSPISTIITNTNLSEGSGDLTYNITGSATLLAPTNEDASVSYYVKLVILNNTLIYTTENNTPELLLTVKKNGSVIVDNRDITISGGIMYIPIILNSDIELQTISASANTTAIDDYEIIIAFKNLDTNQARQANRSFEAKLILSSYVAHDIKVDLTEGMIPVSYDALGNAIIATGDNANNNWYDYGEYKWANMVLVTDASRKTYESAMPGTAVNESDILAYYVYVPRYRYKLFNINADGKTYVEEQLIEVEFEYNTATKSTGNTNGTWLTHPAFTFGDAELSGIWVGKFELTGDVITPTVKPNVISLQSQTVSSLWTTIEKFKTNTIYGLSYTTTDSHMMKNMEWGAVAYLSNSKYGNRGNPFTRNEIFTNPSNYNITGRSGTTVTHSSTTDEPDTASSKLYSWNGYSCSTKIGYVCTGKQQYDYGMSGSTTGTTYGVYDLSGGTYEYVMGNMASSNADYLNHTMYPSGAGTTFGSYTNITLPKKYYDIYDYGTTNYDASARIRGKLGDATTEVASTYFGWNSNLAYFVYSTYSWFIRGGYFEFTGNTGIWSSISDSGNSYDAIFTSRCVLAVE